LISWTKDLFAEDSTYNGRLYFSLVDANGHKMGESILSYTNQEFLFAKPIEVKHGHYFTIASYQYLDSSIRGQGKYAKAIHFEKEGDTLRTMDLKFKFFSNNKSSFGSPLLMSNGNFLKFPLYNMTYGDSIYLFWNDSNGNIIREKEYP
jgi:hypothetical protein